MLFSDFPGDPVTLCPQCRGHRCDPWSWTSSLAAIKDATKCKISMLHVNDPQGGGQHVTTNTQPNQIKHFSNKY